MSIPHYFILENDDNNLSLLLYILDSAGDFSYQVFNQIGTLAEALNNQDPSLIFCKVSMSGCDAREIFKTPAISVPIVFLSDLYNSEERRRCFLNSQHPYISAPFYPEKILPLIKTLYA